MSPLSDDLAGRPYFKPRKPAAPKPQRAPSLFERAGVLVGYPLQTNAAAVAAKCLEHGFSWIAPKVHDGTKPEPGAAEFIRQLRAAAPGLTVVGWGVQQYEPAAEAQFVAMLVHEYKLAAYIADAEGPYKADYRMPDGTMGVRERALEFVVEFRAHLPVLPAALSTFGAGAAKPGGGYWQLGDTTSRSGPGPMDFLSWFRGGFRFLPQAYPNEAGEVYSVPNCIGHALQCHWPRGYVHPMLGCYPSKYPYDPAQYVYELQAGGTVGFSVFLADEMTDEDWSVLGAAARAGKVAR
jgi:hypothetical protein